MTDDPVARVRAVCERWQGRTTMLAAVADDVLAALDAKAAEIERLQAEAVEANKAYNDAEGQLLAQDAEIANLARWKAEALPVLHRLAEIADTVHDSTPGTRHTEIIAAEIERLRAELQDRWREGIDRGDLTPADIGMKRVLGTFTEDEYGQQVFVFVELGEDTRPLWRMP